MKNKEPDITGAYATARDLVCDLSWSSTYMWQFFLTLSTSETPSREQDFPNALVGLWKPSNLIDMPYSVLKHWE